MQKLVWPFSLLPAPAPAGATLPPPLLLFLLLLHLLLLKIPRYYYKIEIICLWWLALLTWVDRESPPVSGKRSTLFDRSTRGPFKPP